MSRPKLIARIVTLAAGGVAVSVASNQVLADHKWHLNWLYLAVAVAVLAALYAEVFSPDSSVGAGSGTSRAGSAVRGRRGVYLRQLRDSVRNMETVGVATQGEFVLGLKQIYVDVSLAPRPPHDTAGEPYVGQAQPSPGERRKLSYFLSGGSQVFAVIGGPGSGKTTLMRSTALALCRRGWRRRRLPILLYLRDHAGAILADDPRALPEVATGAGWVSGKIPASWIERRLDKGGCLVMLDGLDEVADEDDRVKVVVWIRRQIERYPRNDYLVTSRPHGYLSNPLPNANVLQVRRFTGEQISRFLHNWYYAIECRALDATGRQVRIQATAKADDLLGRLRSRPGLYDLAANPLLLTMIANVHRYRDALPGSRAALYAEMCQVLVHRRQEAKGLADQTDLRGPQKEHIMQGLALTMMCERSRDISIADACEAIESDLRGASPEVNPESFLDEVRKSGLLVEREHGRYAFAHLTLQEYLAAAQIGDKNLDRLTGGVDDPWWRETALLWAANANATPVVAACLKSGTVRALSLAFDCADEARTLDPATRGELDELLAGRPDDDPARQRLITGVKAARSLRDVIWLNEDTAICARPVSRDLYAAFVRDEQAAGRHMPKDADPAAASVAADDTAATGMWASDAARFVTWLNNLFDDGTSYRLPTANEINDPAIDLVVAPTRHTIWTDTDAGPRLHQPPGATWPYTPDPTQLGGFIEGDRTRALPYLRLALSPPSLTDVDSFISGFSVALAQAPRSDNSMSLLDIALARDLVRAITLCVALGRVPNGDSALERAVARVHALGRAHTHAHTHALARVGRDRDLACGLALDLARELALDRARVGRAHDHARELARHLAIALALYRDFDYGRAIDLEFEHDLAIARDRGRAIDLDRAIDRAIDRDLDLAIDHAITIAHRRAIDPGRGRAIDLARELARDLDCALDHARAPNPDRVNAIASDSALARLLLGIPDLNDVLASDLDETQSVDLDFCSPSALALDLLLNLRTLTSDIERHENVVEAFRILVAGWEPPRSRKPKKGETLAAFDAYLASIAAATTGPRIRDVPTATLQRFRDLLDTSPSDVASQVGQLLDHVSDLIAPILDRTAPFDGPTLGFARIELLAAAVLVRRADAFDAAEPIIEVVRGLVAIQERAEGHLMPNEVLLLVRA